MLPGQSANACLYLQPGSHSIASTCHGQSYRCSYCSTAPMALSTLSYEEHMSNIQEHSIMIDTEHATTATDKKHTQSIQKVEHECLEASNANSVNCNSGHGTGGQGNDSGGHDSGRHGHGHGCNGSGHEGNSGCGSSGCLSMYIPPELFNTLTSEQWALLFQSSDDNGQFKVHHSNNDNGSTVSEVTSITQTMSAPPQTMLPSPSPGSMVCQMLSNACANHNQGSTGEISVNGQYYTPTG